MTTHSLANVTAAIDWSAEPAAAPAADWSADTPGWGADAAPAATGWE